MCMPGTTPGCLALSRWHALHIYHPYHTWRPGSLEPVQARARAGPDMGCPFSSGCPPTQGTPWKISLSSALTLGQLSAHGDTMSFSTRDTRSDQSPPGPKLEHPQGSRNARSPGSRSRRCIWLPWASSGSPFSTPRWCLGAGSLRRCSSVPDGNVALPRGAACSKSSVS